MPQVEHSTFRSLRGERTGGPVPWLGQEVLCLLQVVSAAGAEE